MKTTLVNLRLENDVIVTLDKLAGKALNRQAVARMLLLAAIEAVEKNQGKLHFPPHFQVADDTFEATTFRINEPKTEKRK